MHKIRLEKKTSYKGMHHHPHFIGPYDITFPIFFLPKQNEDFGLKIL